MSYAAYDIHFLLKCPKSKTFVCIYQQMKNTSITSLRGNFPYDKSGNVEVKDFENNFLVNELIITGRWTSNRTLLFLERIKIFVL